MSFNDLGLRAELLRALDEAGYQTPTPVQAQSIPVILEGKDILAGAQTGTGKTAGFALPILQRLASASVSNSNAPGRRGRPAYRPVRALILTPTRELAAQVEQSVRTYGRYLDIRSVAVFGGVGMFPQVKALREGVDVLVATPGRLLDHLNQRTADLSRVEVVVLDEADRMLDMGFLPDVRRILDMLPRDTQSLLFSATFSREIKELADRMLKEPVMLEVARQNAVTELVTHSLYHTRRETKRQLLTHLIAQEKMQQALVFTRTKHGADHLTEHLQRSSINAVAIHGNCSQSQRTRALADFKQGRAQILVATDIAARGLDIHQLPHVINFELPNVPEDYIHRIGRTGRAGSQGEAISLVSPDERKYLVAIERLLGNVIERREVTDFAPAATGDNSAPPARSAYIAPPAPRGERDYRESNGERFGGRSDARSFAGRKHGNRRPPLRANSSASGR